MKTLLYLLLAAALHAGEKPNIIYINADDLGVMDVGFNSPRYRTPHIDQLRAEGMLFTDAYAPAANCAPSRACVMSGQYSPRHGVFTVGTRERGESADRILISTPNTPFLAPDNLTLAGALQAGGYHTIHLGKWHLGEDPTRQGFDINIGGGAAGGLPDYFAPFKGAMARYNHVYGKGTHSADVFTDQAVKFLREPRTKPFFMHMAYYLVHTPIQGVPGLVENYQDSDGVDPAYASMIEKMDQSIGAILAELKSLGLEEKTLIVFSSDNGGISHISSQAPFRSGKGSYFEGGIREPLVIRWPGKIAAGSTNSVPVMGIDFYPTFLEAAGLPVPEGKLLDGISLMPLLTQSDTLPERDLFWHFPTYLQNYAGPADDAHDPIFRTRPGSAMRHGKWKFHEYFEDGRIELYDLETDPGERSNLAATYPEVAAKLLQTLRQWREATGAPVPVTPNPDYRPR
jgi:arylsulfatase A-like enzyme